MSYEVNSEFMQYDPHTGLSKIEDRKAGKYSSRSSTTLTKQKYYRSNQEDSSVIERYGAMIQPF